MEAKKNTGNQKYSEDELQLLYEACMAYGNQLTEMNKQLSGCIAIIDLLKKRAHAAYQMAAEIALEMDAERKE